MFSYLFAIALVAGATAEPIRSKDLFPNGRIVGGQNAVIETYPYQVSLQYYGSHLCGAAIISEYYVLTAGHCIISSTNLLSVRVGSSFCNQGGRVHQVAQTIRHESYYSNTYGVVVNDIALVRLVEPIVFDWFAQPINLYQSGEESAPGAPAVITGWGTTYHGGWLSNQLQTVSIPILTKQFCHQVFSASVGGLPVGQICAAYYGIGGKDACQGDSGGPLTINGRLAGIISWGNGCAHPYLPGAYTEVAYYRDWIKLYAQV